MQRAVIAIVLCVVAQAASAQTQCVAPSAPVANALPQAPQQAARAELIKTAAAGTRDDVLPATTVSARSRVSGQQDHPRRGGTAMLLAALALMSGIALRRYGAPRA
jgi:hypothetical protein